LKINVESLLWTPPYPKINLTSKTLVTRSLSQKRSTKSTIARSKVIEGKSQEIKSLARLTTILVNLELRRKTISVRKKIPKSTNEKIRTIGATLRKI